MRHHQFEENDKYAVALLSKSSAFLKGELENVYLKTLNSLGIPRRDVIAFTLETDNAKKVSASYAKDYLGKLLVALDSLGDKHLYVADATYFKVLAGVSKAEPNLGYALPCKIKGYEHMTVVLGINYQQLIYNPELQAKVDLSLKTLANSIGGTYQAIGTGIIHSARYPEGLGEIRKALQSLHQYPRLTADIEGFSLDFDKAGLGSIAFAWSKHEGLAFTIDWKPYQVQPDEGYFGWQATDHEVRQLLKEFLLAYQGEITWHNGTGYDIKVIIYNLWMADLLDTAGLLEGLEVMTRRVHDTKIMAYLATNSTAGNVLGLKSLAHEFAGNWAVEEIKDIRRLPKDKLLQYNLVDALSTFYVREKYEPKMIADQQGDLYRDLMLPSATMLIQTELTGLPVSKRRVAEVKAKLLDIQQAQTTVVMSSPAIQALNKLLRETAWDKDLADRKAKAVNPDKIKERPRDAFDDLVFNPKSGQQLQRLLYEVMLLPVIDLTDTKQPATGAETIEKLINHTSDTTHKAVLQALIIYGGVTKILSTFIPAFEAGICKGDPDILWVHGSFNMGGTVSGRLSSSDPNLTNIPAKAEVKIGDVKIHLGKLIKYCFVSPPGWLFAGADYNSLEDMISALTTKDPNKLKVYTDGFDGHSVRAVGYWPEAFPDIDPNDPKQVNVLKKQDHPLRQESKVPTFALTYFGTWRTMVANLGWPEDKAKKVEARYHELYKVSDDYAESRLQQASKDGYVTVAFGLRVRTPLLSQVIFSGPKVPFEAAAEGRTAGNAMGQSYCMLTMRAAMDFMKKVWASPYRYRILPVALIHDAIYVLIEDDVEVVEWANKELIASMRWQELPEIQHDNVKLGANLGIFWPDWAHETTLPNDADRTAIIDICKKAKAELTAA